MKKFKKFICFSMLFSIVLILWSSDVLADKDIISSSILNTTTSDLPPEQPRDQIHIQQNIGMVS